MDEKRPVPTEGQVQSLEKFIPKRVRSLCILNPTIMVHAADLPHADVSKKLYQHRSSKKVCVTMYNGIQYGLCLNSQVVSRYVWLAAHF